MNYKSAATQELVDAYVRAAIDHAEFTNGGNAPKTNAAHHALTAARRELRARGVLRDALQPLWVHPELAVRFNAAVHYLEFEPARAEPIIDEMAKQKSLIGFSAEMTLTLWRNGTLRFAE